MNKINQLHKEDAIYIVGLFDGEGSINLSKLSRLQEHGKTPTYLLRARVRMTDEAIVRWLLATIGGRFYSYQASKGNRKPCFEWNVAGRNVMDFLSQIFPYLRVKRLQAEVAFAYGSTLNKIEGWKLKLSDEAVLAREQLRGKMLVLNKRGI